MKTVAALHWGPTPPQTENRRTMVGGTAVRVARDQRSLFVGAYGMFAARCRAIDEPGVAVVGIDEASGRPAGVLTLLARAGRHVAAIAGRHSACDLALHGNADLALRHLAFVLDPARNWSRGSTQIHYRVLDLRTTHGFSDESGRSLRGLSCDGPAVVRCGGYALFALPLGDPADWPDSAGDAWAMLPERVYLDEVDRAPVATAARDVQQRPALPALPHDRRPAFAQGTHFGIARTRTSVAMRTAGPRDTSRAIAAVGDTAGTLELIGSAHRGTLTLGHEALRDGVLLGRYARCDGAAILDDGSLSRVHGLVLHTGDSLVFVDTASSNGTRVPGGANDRLFALGDGSELELGNARHPTRICWRWTAQ